MDAQLTTLQRETMAQQDAAHQQELAATRESTLSELAQLQTQLEDCRVASGAPWLHAS